jgi:chromodomain-helicase-DNA-binding protein 1
MLQRFHIKWKNFSHLHNTDETYEFLKRYKGMKRVDNYIKSVWQVEQNALARVMSIEEKEAFEIEKERKLEWLEGCKIVERVVASRESANGVEFLCKWKGGARYR